MRPYGGIVISNCSFLIEITPNSSLLTHPNVLWNKKSSNIPFFPRWQRYKITQEIKQALELSESTLYPVLRRLQKDGCLTIYDEPFNGRNRRYYKITPLGRQQLAGYKAEWKVYAANIDHIFGEDAK